MVGGSLYLIYSMLNLNFYRDLDNLFNPCRVPPWQRMRYVDLSSWASLHFIMFFLNYMQIIILWLSLKLFPSYIYIYIFFFFYIWLKKLNRKVIKYFYFSEQKGWQAWPISMAIHHGLDWLKCGLVQDE